MHVQFGFTEGQAGSGGKGARQVGMTAVMVIDFLQQVIGIGITAGTDDIVHTATIFIPAIPVERVVGDRRHRPEPGEGRPEPVAGRQMRAVQRACFARVKPFGYIRLAPQVQIAHLRTFN